jgi:hypothetical protein
MTAAEPAYEEYRELFRITEWRDGCVFRTESLGYGWFPQAEVKANRPAESDLIYAAASDEFAQTHMTIRRAAP